MEKLIQRNSASIIIRLIFILLPGFLFSNMNGQSQTDPLTYLSQRFLSYTGAYQWEEVYIHTDRNEYVAGEDIWFSAYLVNRKTLNPSTQSKILYVTLLNPLNYQMVQQRLILENGFAEGHMVIPDSLVSGTYTIMAYTRWMQNFFPDNCFMKDISIYSIDPTHRFYGKEKIFHNPHFDNYFLTGSGLRMNATVTGSLVRVSVDAETDRDAKRQDNLCLLIHSRGNIVHSGTLRLTDGMAAIAFPSSSFLPGINQVTLFDSLCRPLADKYIYIPPEGNTNDIKVDFPDSAELRQKIGIELVIADSMVNSQGAGFSISISPATGRSVYKGIDEYLLFGTEFGSFPESELRDRKISDLAPEEVNRLIAGLNSNWIRWEKILSPREPEIKYQRESAETIIPGRMTDNNRWPSAKDEFVIMSQPGANAMFQYGLTDSDGFFDLVVPADRKTRDLIIQPDNIFESYTIALTSPFSEELPLTRLVIDSLTEIPPWIPKWRTNCMISRVYGISVTQPGEGPDTSEIRQAAFYGKPDFELLMDDYVKLPLMEEVFFELIPRVRMRKNNGTYQITIHDPAGNQIHNEPPGLMIDGVIIKGAGIIAGMNPDIVKRIDVIYDTYVVDGYMFPGLINVVTKTGYFSTGIPVSGALRIRYSVSDPVPRFSAPDYSSGQKRSSRLPDFRNTMYWNPRVRLPLQGKTGISIYSSDYAGDFILSIQGLSGNGGVFSVSKVINVVNRVALTSR
ncbi:MAG: hypothetical protein MUE74_10185 [Bacteroidales bacterium]|nr:hypothetical protein [Bacteroidales bacterium]